MLRYATLASILLLSFISHGKAQTAFTVGYDFYTLQRALEAKSDGVEYNQDSSGFMFAAESAIDTDSSLIFEYRDAGDGSFTCTTSYEVIEVDGEDYYCNAGDEFTTDANSFAIAYKIYQKGDRYWKFGLGNYRIVYENSNLPEKTDTSLYIGWGIPLGRSQGREGLYLDFGSTLGGTFGIGLAYQFNEQ